MAAPAIAPTNVLSPELSAQFNSFLDSSLGSGHYEVHPLAGDASARRYFRVVSNDDSWVLMLWEPFVDDGQYPFLSVRSHFEKHGVHVPKVVAMQPQKGMVLLEDLGDLTLERKFWESQTQEHCLPYYHQAIDELIKIHYPASAAGGGCTAFSVEFDTAKLLWEMNYGRDHLISGLCSVELNASAQEELLRCFTSICQRLHSEPKFIAHRDYHSRNIMIKLGRVRIIDFQDARMGAVQYDLVSLLRDSYVAMNEKMQAELLDYYLIKRHEAAPSLTEPSRDQFNHIFELQTVQRCFKACGSFASFFMLRQDRRYLKYLAPTLKTVKKSLLLFPEYRAFYSVLNDHGIFEQTFESV